MPGVESFKEELERRVKPIKGVERIEWFGSIADEFRVGSSDLDLIIWGDISAGDKEKISAIIRELNYKHNLGLEKAPYQHPTPFFIDSAAKRLLYDLLVPKGGLKAFEGVSRIWKHHAPTYGQVWALEEKAGEKVPTLAKAVRRLYHELL